MNSLKSKQIKKVEFQSNYQMYYRRNVIGKTVKFDVNRSMVMTIAIAVTPI